MPRLQKTLTDYVVIAISPALIMLLVGSLLFFLIDVFYRGGYEGRVTYIFALFVFAAVLIARIAIEEGRERAVLFAIPLGLAMWLVLGRFTSTSSVLNLAFIALVWWCADKLTWDCTVIDEREDASGEGLLQTVGLERPVNGPANRPDSRPKDLQATSSREAPPQPAGNWWTRFVEKRKRPHAPGVWVIYFSLAALPLFGIGQRFIPSGDEETRRHVFKLFIVYVASGMGLLMTTSFLGLRRYLRQRRLEMPLEMASVWLSVGTMMILALLLVCAVLPRPGSEYSITQVSFQVGSPEDLQASRWGAGSDGAEDKAQHATRAVQSEQQSPDSSSTSTGPGQQGDGQSQGQGSQQGDGAASQEAGSGSEGKPQGQGNQQGSGKSSGGSQGAKQETKSRPGESGQASQDGREGSRSQQDGTRSTDQNASNASQGQSQQGSSGENAKTPSSAEERTSDDKSGEASQADSSGRNGTSGQSPSSSSAASGASSSSFSPSQLVSGLFGTLSYLFKFLYYLFFIVLVGYLLWRYWRQVLEAVSNFVQAIRDLLAGLFGWGRSEAAADEELPAQPVRPPSFADFADPFATGTAERYSPQELLAYSFQALEAWGRDHGYPRELEQTPHEFADRLEACEGHVASQARNLADLYCFEAYSGRTLRREQLQRLREFWQVLRTTPAAKTQEAVVT